MEKIVSKRHLLKFYGALIFFTIAISGMGVFLLLQSYTTYKNDGYLYGKEQYLPFIAIGIFLFNIYLIYSIIKNAPAITITKSTISFNKECYNIVDIESIKLTGKQPLNILGSPRKEGAAIIFKDMTIKYLFDHMYKNTSELKVYLDSTFNKIEPARLNSISKEDILGDHFYYYKGNFFLSMRGLIFTGLVIAFFIPFSVMVSGKDFILIIVCSIYFGMLLLFSSHLNYFGLNNKYFIVKNYIFFWKTTIYKLSDIKEIVYETQEKMPNCLRIITKDYKNKFYPAGTVKTSEWLKMKTLFEKEGIIVRNECI